MYSASCSPQRRIRSTGSEGSLGFDLVVRDSKSFDSNEGSSALSGLSGYSGYSIGSSSQKNGDFHVLQQTLRTHRMAVRRARSTLAATLDRLGEHHIRNKEYDEAMDAFAEALTEKRSVYSNLTPQLHAPSGGGGGGDYLITGEPSQSCGGSVALHSTIDPTNDELHNQSLDDIVQTLSNIGKVHSLRGEHEEAMRYYTEVMNLRATRSNFSKGDTATTLTSTTCSGSSKSGAAAWGDEDTSTIMTELNEDVKALDELFRSISFRNGELRGVGGGGGKTLDRRRRKDGRRNSQLPPRDVASPTRSQKQQRSDHNAGSMGRQSSSKCDETVNELREAMDIYRLVIDTYTGQHLEIHETYYHKFSARMRDIRQRWSQVQLQQDQLQIQVQANGFREEELYLALSVYEQILSAQQDMVSSPLSLPELAHTATTSVAGGDAKSLPCEQQVSSNIASTLIRMGSLHYKLNNVDDELRMYAEAKSVYRQAFGEKHPYVAGTRKNIGMVLAERGEFHSAMAQFEKARKIYISVNNGDEKSRDVASALSCMGNVHNRMGELDDALAKYQEALRIYKSIYDEAWNVGGEALVEAVQDVTSTLKIIGMVHAKRGDFDDAMDYFLEAMKLLRESDSGNCSGVASVLARIAGILYKKGEYDDAMSHYKEAYDLTVKAHGTTKHPDVAGILHYIGGIYHKRSQFVDAMSYYKDSVRIYHATLGADNPAVATTLVCIGSIHYKKNNLDTAMIFYNEALRLNRDSYGVHHPDVAPTLKSIGMIHTKKGEYDQALDVFREVLNIKCTMHGTGHPEVASSYKCLGNVHFKRGELADAERQYRNALSIYRRWLGENHPDTISTRRSIEHIRENMRKKREQADINRAMERRDSFSSSRSRSSRHGSRQRERRDR